MIICPTCGKENEDFFKFCLGCGADLARAGKLDEGPTVEGESSDGAAKADPSTRRAGGSGERVAEGNKLERTCRICGASQDPAFAFCADCGASFAELHKTGPIPTTTPSPPRSGAVAVRERWSSGGGCAERQGQGCEWTREVSTGGSTSAHLKPREHTTSNNFNQ